MGSIQDDLSYLATILEFKKTNKTIVSQPLNSLYSITKLKKIIPRDLDSYLSSIRKKTNPGDPGYVYYEKIHKTVDKLKKVLKETDLSNNESLSDIVVKVNECKMPYYEQMLHSINLTLLNGGAITGKDSKYYAFFLVLGLINYLFINGTLVNEENSTKREHDVCKRMSNLDSKMRVTVNGNCLGLFYHIKNGVSHGNISIENDNYLIEDKNAKVTIEGKIDEFVSDYLSCSEQIESRLLNHKSLYNSTHDIISYSVNGNPIVSDGMTTFLSILHYLSSSDRNKKMISYIMSSCSNKIDPVTLFKYDVGGGMTTREIRNSFSHWYEILENGVKLDNGVELDGWAWMYCFDSTSIICNTLIMELALGSLTVNDYIAMKKKTK